MKTYWGVEVYIHAFLTLALRGGEWSASCPVCFTPLPPGKEPRYLLDSRLSIKLLAGLRKEKPPNIAMYATYGQPHSWICNEIIEFQEVPSMARMNKLRPAAIGLVIDFEKMKLLLRWTFSNT